LEPVAAEDSLFAEASSDSAPTDETKQLLERLTISMGAEVLDERTFVIRDTAKAGRKLLRLGNVAPPEKGALGDAEYREKLEAAKSALSTVVGKQMIWWKAAPDEHQPPAPADGSDPVVLADVWLIDGRHVNTFLRSDGHLALAQEYHEELARNILTAEADENKKKSYKELEEAMRESSKAQAKEAKEAREKEAKEASEAKEAEAQALGVGGWIGIVMVLALLGGVVIAKVLGLDKRKKKRR